MNENLCAKFPHSVVKFAAQRRTEFPIFSRYPEWSYLDSAATAQKPQQVIDSLYQFWCEQNAPLHRGVYHLSSTVTKDYEVVRRKIANWIGAQNVQEIIFCRGTTEAINLVAHSFVAPKLKADDNIVISSLEHHANFVPWQQLCKKYRAELRCIPLKWNHVAGAFRNHLQVRLDIEAAESLLDNRTRILALSHVSNVLGTIQPVAELVELAQSRNIPVLLDGAQAVVHNAVNVAALGCDFYVFSGHKLYGPDGIGVLFGRRELLEQMPPYQTGGDMIEWVSKEDVTFAPVPQRFEAGTMPVSAVMGLGAAIDYISSLPMDLLVEHERELLHLASEILRNSKELQKVQIIGDEDNLTNKVGVLSFAIDNIHPHDIGSILDSVNVAVRAGHHCAQPLMTCLGLSATARASFAVYNNMKDLERLFQGIEKAIRLIIG